MYSEQVNLYKCHLLLLLLLLLIIIIIIIIIINIGKSFKYLGRYFNFSMDNSNHMSILLETTHDLMT